MTSSDGATAPLIWSAVPQIERKSALVRGVAGRAGTA